MRAEIKRTLQTRIDSHQHFWKYSPSEHTWMTPEMGTLKRDYLPDDLRPLLDNVGFSGSIAVQARQNLAETSWLLSLAKDCSNIFGVVGWVDLQSPDVEHELKTFADNPHLVGVRHVVHDEPDDEFMLRPEFQQGIRLLTDFDLAYDLLLFPRHLKPAVELVKRFPSSASSSTIAPSRESQRGVFHRGAKVSTSLPSFQMCFANCLDLSRKQDGGTGLRAI